MAGKRQAGWGAAPRFQTGNSSRKICFGRERERKWERVGCETENAFHVERGEQHKQRSDQKASPHNCHFFQPLLMLQTTGEGWLNQDGDSSVLVWLLSRPFSCCAANFPSKWGMGLLVLAGGHNQPSANSLPRELTLLSLLGFSSFVKLCHSICSEDILRGQGASF